MTRLTAGDIGRNDPCPCGSGKKYKKCCGKDTAADLVNQELDKSLRAVLQDFFENHPRPDHQKELLAFKDRMEDLLVPLYGEEKAASVIGDLFFFHERKDVWNSFIEKQLTRTDRRQLRQLLEGWLNPLFVAGEVAGIVNYQATVRDIPSSEEYTVLVNEAFPASEGSTVLGFFVKDIRYGDDFIMPLNSVVVAEKPTEDALDKLHRLASRGRQRLDLIAVYQLFGTGSRSPEQAPPDFLETAETLERVLVDADVKSDELMETFFHYLEHEGNVPEAAVAGAMQFGIESGLLPLDWTADETASRFSSAPEDVERFAESLRKFHAAHVADTEKEAVYAFEVGTDPKADEFRNWQLLMHLKDLSITNESVLQRQIDYYRTEPYEPKTAAEHAQKMAYEAYRAESEEARAELAAEVLRLDAGNADGILLAAEQEAAPDARLAKLQEAVTAAHDGFDPEMDVAWLYVTNRPYLRALFNLGVFYWENGQFEEAFREFYRILQLNPGDHQGARYPAISSLIALGRSEDAESLIGHYDEAHTDNAFYAWFRWAIERKKGFFSPETHEAYQEAADKNPYMEKYVKTRRERDPYPKSAAITPRSPEEAKLIWTYVQPAL
ncbi:tetratricopeptide repeat protein [Indiicoccus explosivorum]|uniref:tetratricopeptide repeat protein n=1 Tax=Indiicoccus explosivorum TaxID=1917864 RepID=UPI000B43D9B7|nr:tetratricopeptide repeat protein [Indiicoccus explosivorum]